MKYRLFSFLLFASLAQAHFVFVVPNSNGASANVILSEDLKSTEEVDVGLIGGTKLSLRNADGHEMPLSLVKAEHAYVAELPGAGTRPVHGTADLGWMQRGGKPHVLLYYPKTIIGDAFHSKQIVGAEAPVEMVPLGNPGAVTLELLVRGEPKPDAEITVILPDGSQQKLKTNAAGQTDPLTQTGRYGAWARYWEPSGGERDGKKYEETRHYATLVFDAQPSTSLTASRFGTLPQATSSFGEVVSDGWLYVYGGHIAHTHSYSTDAVSGRFNRLKLADGKTWEQLPGGPGLQGMNLAAFDGKIYRIGGMTPRNKPDERAATYSVADCARFDPASGKWEPLPPLPDPRSSHDVVVIDGKLIVVGGWTLKGPAGEQWLETLEVLDLAAQKLEWKRVKQPFKRRALIAAAYSGQIYVIGGFDEHGKIVRDVSIYNPKTNAWTNGPPLPGDEMNAFAPAACVHEGSLYVSVADGGLYRLEERSRQWEKSGSGTPRLAHRIGSWGDSILISGGAAKGNNSDLIEAVVVEQAHVQ